VLVQGAGDEVVPAQYDPSGQSVNLPEGAQYLPTGAAQLTQAVKAGVASALGKGVEGRLEHCTAAAAPPAQPYPRGQGIPVAFVEATSQAKPGEAVQSVGAEAPRVFTYFPAGAMVQNCAPEEEKFPVEHITGWDVSPAQEYPPGQLTPLALPQF